MPVYLGATWSTILDTLTFDRATVGTATAVPVDAATADADADAVVVDGLACAEAIVVAAVVAAAGDGNTEAMNSPMYCVALRLKYWPLAVLAVSVFDVDKTFVMSASPA